VTPDDGMDPVSLNEKPRFGLVDVALWAIMIALAAAPVISDLSVAQGDVLPSGNLIGRDFLNAWAGGQLAYHGRVAEIYAVHPYLSALSTMVGRPVDFHAFSYPPTLLLFLWPFGLIGYLPALVIWLAATGAAFVVAARSYLAREGIPAWVVALFPASIVNVWAGHHGFVLAALWLAAFAFLPKRPLLAGLAISLLTLKPHMGVLIPLVLLVRCEWRTMLAAACGTLLLFAASVAAFGLSPWMSYFHVTTQVQADLLGQTTSFFLKMMPTPYVGFWVATHSVVAAALAQALFAVAAILIVVRSARSAMAWPQLGLVTATATFLVLPYAFNYDMGVVSVGAALLLYGRGRSLDAFGRLSAWLALTSPILVFGANLIGAPLIPFALLAFLWVQARAYAPAEQQRQLTAVPA
jgi:alpha-1,2-mannosyltransferase